MAYYDILYRAHWLNIVQYLRDFDKNVSNLKVYHVDVINR